MASPPREQVQYRRIIGNFGVVEHHLMRAGSLVPALEKGIDGGLPVWPAPPMPVI